MDKIPKVATKLYGASEVVEDTKVRARMKQYQSNGYGHYPICIAKTQYAFSTDPLLRGARSNHVVPARDVYLAAGAEFVVAICGDIITLPGLPQAPHACQIDLNERGNVVGLT